MPCVFFQDDEPRPSKSASWVEISPSWNPPFAGETPLACVADGSISGTQIIQPSVTGGIDQDSDLC